MIGAISYAQNEPNGNIGRHGIDISGMKAPKPHMAEVTEPQAYYTVSTATLSIELDPVYYSQYTIILQSDYASLDYIVTSPVVNIPVGSLDSVVDIYIESDDCGCYYGTLNQSAYGNTY
ncbi:MAG: hypothetical protein J6I72_07245 [Muribaculaceae bacterium]|nr:hypothetical protein [Muribaculaceae bacterium]